MKQILSIVLYEEQILIDCIIFTFIVHYKTKISYIIDSHILKYSIGD